MESRATNFKNKGIGPALDNILERRKPNVKLDRVLKTDENGIPYIETDPVEVEPVMHIEETDWAEWYQPLEDIDSGIWRGLTDPPCAEELRAAAYVSLASGKAPGKSSTVNETFQQRWALHTKSQRHEEWNGDIWGTRPISLLESSKKGGEKVIQYRLMKIHDMFPWLLPGSTLVCYQEIQQMTCIIFCSNGHGRSMEEKEPLLVWAEDMKKGFDSQSPVATGRAFRALDSLRYYWQVGYQSLSQSAQRVVKGIR
ncbi:hypothetical protein BJ742DRAFT_745115 [Cladochytrium replicatum]|nr:hypothetical protein BJ742DRAFT_745115 [Cladochytrium replicatum]